MKKSMRRKAALITASLAIMLSTSVDAKGKEASSDDFQPMVVHQFLEKARRNTNWKVAFATAEHEQIVFMNISPRTNPDNEIGREVHDFDQVILIVEGKGKAILNGKTAIVNSGDMIFIPEGIPHNVVNLGGERELKLISFYSDTDMPKDDVYETKADAPEE